MVGTKMKTTEGFYSEVFGLGTNIAPVRLNGRISDNQ